MSLRGCSASSVKLSVQTNKQKINKRTYLGHKSGSCKSPSHYRYVQWHICQFLTRYYLRWYHKDNNHFSNMFQECPRGKNLWLLLGYVDWMTVLWGFVDLFWIMHCFHHFLYLGLRFDQSRHQFRSESRDNWKKDENDYNHIKRYE